MCERERQAEDAGQLRVSDPQEPVSSWPPATSVAKAGSGSTSPRHRRRHPTPAVILLGSSGYSAQLAGILGLPFAFAHHFDTGGTLQALDLYRSAFEPSTVLDQPHAIVTANVLTAPTAEEAAWLAAPDSS